MLFYVLFHFVTIIFYSYTKNLTAESYIQSVPLTVTKTKIIYNIRIIVMDYYKYLIKIYKNNESQWRRRPSLIVKDVKVFYIFGIFSVCSHKICGCTLLSFRQYNELLAHKILWFLISGLGGIVIKPVVESFIEEGSGMCCIEASYINGVMFWGSTESENSEKEEDRQRI